MTKNFDVLYNRIIAEAADDSELPDFGQQQDQGGDTQMDQGLADLSPDELGMDESKPVPPEELELAHLAIRAVNFDIKSKDVHQYGFQDNTGNRISFEQIPSYFEETKDWRRVLKFIEWLINKFEGVNSQWAEEQELKGKNIIQKISIINRKNKANPELQLDNSKRLVWTRIILNALINSDSSMNIIGSDIDEKSLPDIFNQLKQNFMHSSTGLFANKPVHPINN